MNSHSTPSPYGDDRTVELFLFSVDSLPKTAINIWQRALRKGIFVNAAKPSEFTNVIDRLEHGDSLDSIEATLRRMWQGLEERYLWDFDPNENICRAYDGILVQCGRYFLSPNMPDDVRRKWKRFFSRVLGDEETLDAAIRLAKTNA